MARSVLAWGFGVDCLLIVALVAVGRRIKVYKRDDLVDQCGVAGVLGVACLLAVSLLIAWLP